MAKLALIETATMMKPVSLDKQPYDDQRTEYDGKNGILMVVKIPDKGTVYGQFITKWPDGTIHRLCTSPGTMEKSNVSITIKTSNSIYSWKRNASLIQEEYDELNAYIEEKLVSQKPKETKRGKSKKPDSAEASGSDETVKQK